MINTYKEAQSYLRLKELADQHLKELGSTGSSLKSFPPTRQKKLQEEWKSCCRMTVETGSALAIAHPKGLKRALTILARWYLFEEKKNADEACEALKNWYQTVMTFLFSITVGEKAMRALLDKLQEALLDKPKKQRFDKKGDNFVSHNVSTNLDRMNAYHAVCRARAAGPLENTVPFLPRTVLEQWAAIPGFKADSGLLLMLAHFRGVEDIYTKQDFLLWSKHDDGGSPNFDEKLAFFRRQTLYQQEFYRIDAEKEAYQWDDGPEEDRFYLDEDADKPRSWLNSLLKTSRSETAHFPLEFDRETLQKKWDNYVKWGKAGKAKNISLPLPDAENRAETFAAILMTLFLAQEQPETPVDDWESFWAWVDEESAAASSQYEPFRYLNEAEIDRIEASWPAFRRKLLSASAFCFEQNFPKYIIRFHKNGIKTEKSAETA